MEVLKTVAAVLVIVAALGIFPTLRDRYQWRTVRRQRVIVVTADGTSLEAVLLDQRGPLLFLGDARVLSTGGSQRMDGEPVIERAQVRWIQVLR